VFTPRFCLCRCRGGRSSLLQLQWTLSSTPVAPLYAPMFSPTQHAGTMCASPKALAVSSRSQSFSRCVCAAAAPDYTQGWHERSDQFYSSVNCFSRVLQQWNLHVFDGNITEMVKWISLYVTWLPTFCCKPYIRC
jgi:hypothetical protein